MYPPTPSTSLLPPPTHPHQHRFHGMRQGTTPFLILIPHSYITPSTPLRHTLTRISYISSFLYITLPHPLRHTLPHQRCLLHQHHLIHPADGPGSGGARYCTGARASLPLRGENQSHGPWSVSVSVRERDTH